MERFTGSFTQQEPIPEDGIEAAIAVLRHGRRNSRLRNGFLLGETAGEPFHRPPQLSAVRRTTRR